MVHNGTTPQQMIEQGPTEFGDDIADALEGTVATEQTCPSCKQPTLTRTEHLGIVGEQCSHCDHRDSYTE